MEALDDPDVSRAPIPGFLKDVDFEILFVQIHQVETNVFQSKIMNG